MNWPQALQAIFVAIALAVIFAFAKLFERLKALEIQVKPVVDWYVTTSMQALKLATNPTSERLSELADRYIAHVRAGTVMDRGERQELIDGLLEIFNDRRYAEKRQSASVALSFIETHEGIQIFPRQRGQ